MITSVDTNIILDVLIPGESSGESSKVLLDRHLSMGELVICEIVFAELAAAFSSEEQLQAFLSDTRIRVGRFTEQSLFLAGSRWAEYTKKSVRNQFSCANCGHLLEVSCPQCKTQLAKRFHVLADFMIGAHALLQADCLLSRDLGVYRTYFKDLQVVGPI